MSTAGNAPSLFHITRCAQNRLPREQPTPAPNSEPAAIALCSPYCLANVPRTPQRTPRPHTRAHTRSIRSPVPEKTSLSCATRSHPCPIQPLTRPTNPHDCAISPHQSRNFANPLETPAHPCYPRPREGPTPRPGNPYPHTGKAPGIVGTSKTGHRPPTRPLSYSVTRRHFCVTTTGARHYRLEQDRRHPQLRVAQNVAETNRIRCPVFARTTELGAPGNLKQARNPRPPIRFVGPFGVL